MLNVQIRIKMMVISGKIKKKRLKTQKKEIMFWTENAGKKYRKKCEYNEYKLSSISRECSSKSSLLKVQKSLNSSGLNGIR